MLLLIPAYVPLCPAPLLCHIALLPPQTALLLSKQPLRSALTAQGLRRRELRHPVQVGQSLPLWGVERFGLLASD